MPYESEKLKSRVFYYLCMVLAGCILANIVLRCDRNLQVFILPFTDSSRLAGVSVQQTLFYVLLQRTKQVAVVYLLYKVFPPKAVFSIGMSALLFLFGFVISCQMFYLGLSGVWFLLLCLFPHYLIYLPLWDSVYQTVYRESMGIWRNHGIFPQKVSAYLLKVLLYTALYGAGILLEWRVNPWILNKILDFSKFFE